MNIEKIKEYSHTFVLNRMTLSENENVFKAYIIIFILFLLSFFGAIAIIPTVVSSIEKEKWLVLFLILCSYSTIPFLLFTKNISYKIRSVLLCLAIFLCGFIVMTNAPLLSSARLWFLCATVLACFLLGNKSAFYFFILSMISLIWSGYIKGFNLSLPVESGETIWIITLSSFVLINIIVVGSSYLLKLGLIKAEEDLKRSEKLKVNLQLIQNIEEMDQLITKISQEYNATMSVILGHANSALMETSKNKELIFNLTEIQKIAQEAEDLSKHLISLIPKNKIY